MRTPRENHRPLVARDDGAALVVALLMLLGLAAMGMAAVMISSTDFVVAGTQRQRAAALHTAEAGLAEAMYRLSARPGTTVNVAGAAVDISIRDTADPPSPAWTARIYNTTPGAQPGSTAQNFTTGTMQAAGDYLEYSHASDPGQAILIRHKLRDFDGNGVDEVVFFDPSRVPPENPSEGWPVERITVTGRQGQAERVIQADVIRFPINPNVFAAMLADGEVDLRGNVTVCGHNHRMDTPPGTQLPQCSPMWNETNGSLIGVMTTGGSVGTRGSTDLSGSPSPTDTDPANIFQTAAQTLGLSDQEFAQILASADRTSLDGGGPWDGITHVQGNLRVNGGSGSGLLYVEGNLELRGNFNWTGLIFVEGVLTNTGNTWILGAVMARGGGEVVAVDFGAGTPAILYSREAIVQSLLSAMDYIVLNWKEL